MMDDMIPILAYMLQDPTCHGKRSVSVICLKLMLLKLEMIRGAEELIVLHIRHV